MMRFAFLFLILALFSMSAIAQDWLEGGYVGSPDYGEIRQYFTDPIFYTQVPVSQPLSFYGPFIGNTNLYPYYPTQSEFRNRSLAALQWEPFAPNWASTISYAGSKSSFRVYEGGAWRSL
jgi:hypothetical protein